VFNKGHFANFVQNRLPWQRHGKNKKEVRIEKIHAITLHLVKTEKIVKFGPLDPEIIWLKLKKEEEISASKIYSQVGKCAERAKLATLGHKMLYQDCLSYSPYQPVTSTAATNKWLKVYMQT